MLHIATASEIHLDSSLAIATWLAQGMWPNGLRIWGLQVQVLSCSIINLLRGSALNMKRKLQEFFMPSNFCST